MHSFIRSITVNSLQPGNRALLQWLENDIYLKAHYGKKNVLGALADKLAELQTHLILLTRQVRTFPRGINQAVDDVLAKI